MKKSQEKAETSAIETAQLLEPVELSIPIKETIQINPNNRRKIVEIPTVRFSNYCLIPKSNPVLYYEMVSDFFESPFSANHAMTDEEFEAWGNNDDFIISVILKQEGLERA